MSRQGPSVTNVAPSGFFVLRTPLLPFDELTSWGAELEAAGADADAPGGLDDAVARDRARLRLRLAEAVLRPEFRDALFVASPSLDAAVDLWRKEPDSERGRAAESSLVSYFSRAAARPTPFGLFAGCTTGTIGTTTTLLLQGRARYRRHTRLDMDYLWALAEQLEHDPALREDLCYRPNSSLYEVGDRLLYAEAQQAPGGRSYRLVALEKTPYLLETLRRAEGGQRLGALAEALVDDEDEVTLADAEEYITDLVDSQVLVADVRPQLTGPPPTDSLVATLAGHERTASVAHRLALVRADLASLDAQGVGAAAERYRDAAAELEALPTQPEPSRFVQVDLTKPAERMTLAADLVAELVQGIDALHAFTRQRPHEGLRQFREQFVRRYETREMPLAQVLDEETGIGFERSTSATAEAAPLLAGLPLFPYAEQPGRWIPRDAYLQDKLARALADGSREIEITAADVEAVRRPDTLPLPDAFEVLATVGATERHSAVLRSVSGPSGARIVGRFCHADPRLHELVRDHLRAEEAARPDCVFAEVVHLPHGRVGNIMSRPVLRDYEIPFLGRSGAAEECQIPLSDLLVSVDHDRVVLRSRRLDREVLPRLTTAHNSATGGLGVYRFLCALQHEDVVQGLLWDWGPLDSAPFLPRVVCGRVVMSRARWNLRERELAAFREPRGARQFRAVQRLRHERGMPRYVAVAEADNELVVDLENVLSIEAAARQLAGRSFGQLVELLPAPDDLTVSGPEGKFTNEIVVPFVRSSPRPAQHQPPRSHAAVARRFPPGSEWLYVKLFTGPATADEVLSRAVPVVTRALARGQADRWFFIRYGDPDWHVRLRLHGTPERLLGETLPLLHGVMTPLVETGQLWRVELDTYEREVGRYGGPDAIASAEDMFHADSDAVVEILRHLPGDAGADLRWRVALLGIDLIFDDLGLSLEERRKVARRAREGYGREFGAGPAFQNAVSKRFRTERPAVEMLFDVGPELTPELAASVQALHGRSAAVVESAREMRDLWLGGRLSADLGELAMSLAHMHVNRLLRSAQRAQELVLYEFLDRIYSSRAARRAP